MFSESTYFLVIAALAQVANVQPRTSTPMEGHEGRIGYMEVLNDSAQLLIPIYEDLPSEFFEPSIHECERRIEDVPDLSGN